MELRGISELGYGCLEILELRIFWGIYVENNCIIDASLLAKGNFPLISDIRVENYDSAIEAGFRKLSETLFRKFTNLR